MAGTGPKGHCINVTVHILGESVQAKPMSVGTRLYQMERLTRSHNLEYIHEQMELKDRILSVNFLSFYIFKVCLLCINHMEHVALSAIHCNDHTAA